MKQIIPFTKDIALKSVIKELTSISLDHDLELKGEDLISGNFYVKGKYKLNKETELEEDFSYKIPCEIAISDNYDTFDAVIDIDDFNYEVIENEILKVNISLCIDNLIKKEKEERTEKEEKTEEIDEDPEEHIETLIEEDERLFFNDNYDVDKLINADFVEKEEEKQIINTTIEPIKTLQEETKIFEAKEEEYSTYYVYLVQENDTFSNITEKYHCKKEDLLLYNDIKELEAGMKLIIPEIKNG